MLRKSERCQNTQQHCLTATSSSLYNNLNITNSNLLHRTEKGDSFLWDTLIYFKRYLVVKEVESDKNLKMPGYL